MTFGDLGDRDFQGRDEVFHGSLTDSFFPTQQGTSGVDRTPDFPPTTTFCGSASRPVSSKLMAWVVIVGAVTGAVVNLVWGLSYGGALTGGLFGAVAAPALLIALAILPTALWAALVIARFWLTVVVLLALASGALLLVGWVIEVASS